jgi:hypothetical protein
MKKQYFVLVYLMCYLSGLTQAQSEKSMAQAGICREKLDSLIFVVESCMGNSDIANIWIIPPMGCPRCEGVSALAMGMFRNQDPGEKHIVWIDRYYKENLKTYLRDRKFPSDTILDATSGIMSDWMSINLGQFQTPHYLRYNRTKKSFVSEHSLLGANVSNDWIKEIRLEQNNPVQIVSCLNSNPKAEMTSVQNEGFYDQSISFEIPGDIPEFSQRDISEDRQEVCLVDNFSWDIIRLQRSNNTCSRVSILSQLPLDTFISSDAPESIVRMLKKSGVINYMVFSPKYGRNKDLYVGISLPKIVFSDNNLGYYNEAVLVNSDWRHSWIKGCFETDSALGFQTSHTRFFLDRNEKNLFMKCNKGWPVIGTSSYISNDSHESPFRRDFYDLAPALAISDLKGKVYGHMGKLDDLFSRTRTGYYYSNISAAFHRDTFYFTNGYSGQIYSQFQDIQPVFSCPDFKYIYSQSVRGSMKMEDGTEVPVLPESDAPVLELEPDSQLNYIIGIHSFLPKWIEEFGLNDRFVCTITKSQERIKYWTVYNRQTGKVLQRLKIPEYYGRGHLCATFVGKDANNVLYLEALYLQGTHLEWCSRPVSEP